MPSHDLNVIGLAGVAAPEDGTDISVPSVQVAALGGSLNAISGILMALYARERTGKGQLVNVDLYSSAINAEITAISSVIGCREPACLLSGVRHRIITAYTKQRTAVI